MYLEKKNYQAAADELEQAAALDPDMARNHNNLCAAYVKLDNYDQAWVHARKAVLCSYQDNVGDYMFRQLCDVMIIKKGLSKAGTPVEIILEELGPPDFEPCGDLQYGLWIFSISKGRVVSSRMLPLDF